MWKYKYYVSVSFPLQLQQYMHVTVYSGCHNYLDVNALFFLTCPTAFWTSHVPSKFNLPTSLRLWLFRKAKAKTTSKTVLVTFFSSFLIARRSCMMSEPYSLPPQEDLCCLHVLHQEHALQLNWVPTQIHLSFERSISKLVFVSSSKPEDSYLANT